jgi:hypothetical protein
MLWVFFKLLVGRFRLPLYLRRQAIKAFSKTLGGFDRIIA